MRREFLMKAHPFDKPKAQRQHLGGWMISEKLDGIRAFWDGGITRGLPKASVPWANTAKDSRYKDEQIATGLWSMYGNVIHAHDNWLDSLPRIPLDGELWLGRGEGTRQRLTRIVKQLNPTTEWEQVGFYCFDTVPLAIFATDGEIKNPNFHKILTGCRDFVSKTMDLLEWAPSNNISALSSYKCLQQRCQGAAIAHRQSILPSDNDGARLAIQQYADMVFDEGGEGVMVRNPIATWNPKREWHILKVKDVKDMEATVVGFTTGEETDKGSKLLGLIGAVLVKMDNGLVFKLSGFTDHERIFETVHMTDWAKNHPGVRAPDHFDGHEIKLGQRLTFKYRELTEDGYPQEARYWRKRGGHD